MGQYRISTLAKDAEGEWKPFTMEDFQRDCAKWARMGCEFKVQFRALTK